MNSFLKYAQSNAPDVYSALNGKKPGSAAFDQAWRQLASSNPKKFEQVQHNFIKQSHYDPAASKIKQSTGFDAAKSSPAIQDVLWSTAVQHGSGGANTIFRAAGIKPGMSDREIIQRVYAERAANNGMKYFSKSSESIRKSVVNRFKREMQDALSQL